MKIDKKLFDKLPQLDRIEFRQRYENCYVHSSIGNLLWYLLIIFVVLITSGFADAAMSMVDLMINLFLIEIALIIGTSLITKASRKKLCEEYFKVGIKKRK